MAISNYDNVIDSREVIERIGEIKEELSDTDTVMQELVDELKGELATLKKLAGEGESSPDWEYGQTLVRDSYFEDYARELAEETGMVSEVLAWPVRCIDWEQAAEELQMDYFTVDYDGVDYWIRGIGS